MPATAYSDPIIVRGDMLASLQNSPYQQGNTGDADFGIVMPGVEALGSSDDLFRLIWTSNINNTDTEFSNGQGWQLEKYDPANDPDNDPSTGNEGWTVEPDMDFLTPKDDLASNTGSGDDYIIFDSGSGFILYDLDGNLPTSPTTLTYLEADNDGDPSVGDNDGALGFHDSYQSVVCFTAGTEIATPQGWRRVENLRPGDMVLTRDNAEQPVVWTAERRLSRRELALRPNLHPVRIRAGALGPANPSQDLLVSPQHRILLHSKIAERMFGTREVLVPAIKLIHLPGVAQMQPLGEVVYHHFLLEKHHLITANGAVTESFFPGQQALHSITKRAREELFILFPELGRTGVISNYHSARLFVSGKAASKLVNRHIKHRVWLSAA